LGVNGGVGSAEARAETISIVKVSVIGFDIVKVSVKAGIEVGARVGIEVGAEVGIKVGAKLRIVTTRKIGRTGTGSIIRVFGGFKVKVRSSGKS
jgi:hypothetical protein